MRLGNILKQAGGIVETGRAVRFQIRVRAGKGTKSVRKWCDALILPLSEDERAAAAASARAYLAEHPEADRQSEAALALVAAFLYDSENSALRFALSDEMPALRAGLTEDQLAYLLRQYAEHIQDEYPELRPPTTREAIETQIASLQRQLAALAEQAAGE